MDLDGLLRQLQLGGQKLTDFKSLVTLHLNNFSQLVVLDDVTVTGKVLLQDFQDLLQVIFAWQTLDSGQGLSTVTLLDTDMDVVGWLRV